LGCGVRKTYPDWRNKEKFSPGNAVLIGFINTFWSYIYKQYDLTKNVNILSCSVDCQSPSQGEEGLSVCSTAQATQTMTGEQTGTCGSEY